jgi:hypothetical protein
MPGVDAPAKLLADQCPANKRRTLLRVGTRLVVIVWAAAYVILGMRTQLALVAVKPLPQFLDEDFSYYARAFFDAAHGFDPYEIRSIGPAYLYPPPALLVIAPFALVTDVYLRAVLLLGTDLVLAGLMVWGIARTYGLAARQVWWWFPLILTFAPFLEMLHIGQINMLVLFCVFIVFVWHRRHPTLAGAALSLGVAIKLVPALVVGYLIVRRAWGALVGASFGLFALTVLSFAAFGWRPVLAYPSVLIGMLSATLDSYAGNAQSLAVVLEFNRLIQTDAESTVQKLLTAYCLAAIGASMLFAWRTQHHEPLFLIIGFLGAVMPNILWYHHYVFLLLPVLVWMAWSHMEPRVLVWCLAGLTAIQIDRWELTQGLLAHAFAHLSALGLLVWQARHWRLRTGVARASQLAATRSMVS